MAIKISRTAEAALRNHVAECPASEVCGLLFGNDARIATASRARNLADSPRDSFEIDPQAMFEAIRSGRAGGPRLVGHYHSHPHGSAIPSARDEAMALDVGRLWLIVAGDDWRLWRVVSPHRFAPVELALASAQASRQ